MDCLNPTGGRSQWLAKSNTFVESGDMKAVAEIRKLAQNRFDDTLVDEFVASVIRLSAGFDIIDSVLQISTDEGEELEFGFFTENSISDITLSRGKVYFCTYRPP